MSTLMRKFSPASRKGYQPPTLNNGDMKHDITAKLPRSYCEVADCHSILSDAV